MATRTVSRIACMLALLCSVESVAQCLTMPSPHNLITSMYGYRFHPVYKKWRLHKGVDLRAFMGTELVATHSGEVQVTHSSSGGNEIRIVSPQMVTRYLHLTRALVSPGASVQAGEKIAISGNTGHASAAPHLHLEAYPAGKPGDVNPVPLFCTAPQMKSGADTVSGFPILQCNPDAAQCDSTGGPPPMVAGGGPGGVITDAPQGPNITQFDDMSTNEIFEAEIAKRFTNPDWYRELAEMDSRPLQVEQAHIKALRQYVRLHEQLAVERIEQLLAIKAARNIKSTEEDMKQSRDAALRP